MFYAIHSKLKINFGMVDPALQTFYENYGTRGEVGVQPFDGADVKDDRVRWEWRNLTEGEQTLFWTLVDWKWWGPPKSEKSHWSFKWYPSQQPRC